jgi:hypothetical protein
LKPGTPAFALAKVFVKCMGQESIRRVTLDVWAEYNATWASKRMLDSVWGLVEKAREFVA